MTFLFVVACQKKPSSQRAWQQQASPEPAVTYEPLPPEPPVEVLRVPNSGLPCDVEEVLVAKCRRCHTTPTRHAAPFPLLTWEDTQQIFRDDRPRFKVMASAIKSGFMPYNTKANPPVEPATDAEKQVIIDWAEAGAPRASCPPTPAPSASAGRAKRAKPPK